MKERINFIWIYARKHIILFILLFTSILATSIFGVLYPVFLGKIIDGIIKTNHVGELWKNFLLFCGVFVCQQTARFVNSRSYTQLNVKFSLDIKRDLFERMLEYKPKHLVMVKKGDLIRRLSKDVDDILNYIHINIFYLISDVAEFLFQLAVIAYISLPIFVMTVICMPISFYITYNSANRAEKHYKKVAEQKGILSSLYFEVIKGLTEIRLLSASKAVLRKCSQKNVVLAREIISTSKVEVLTQSIVNVSSVVIQLALYGLSSLLIIENRLSIGEFIAISTMFNSSLELFSDLAGRRNSITQNMVSIDRVMEAFNTETESDNENVTGCSISRGELRFENVTFGYNDNESVINDLSFHIKPFEHIAVVGTSGSGKSTLAALLTKQYQISSGNITIDNQDLQDYHTKDIRNQIAVVLQDSGIFNGTIRYNICFDNSPQNDELLWSALEFAGAAEFVRHLPQQLDTVIGDDAIDLSGGQKQRLAISRLFMRDPKILVLDEATSALDGSTEENINISLQSYCQKRTTITITHRLSTAILADRIIMIENGEIVGNGSHLELLDSCSEYRTLFHKQNKIDGVMSI